VHIEVVTVSVGFGDILAETLPANLPLVDGMVVVTSPADEETQQVCRRHSVRCIVSEDGDRDGPFNKARLIQRGFDQIGGLGWVLHLDSDIVLPQQFRRLIDLAHLDETCIYGADRQNVVGWDAWQRLKQYAGGWNNHSNEVAWWFHPHFQPSSRWVSSIHGWAPPGFFQLLYYQYMIMNGYHNRTYPMHHGSAARTDIQFSLTYDRRKRVLLPEIIVLHLESELAPLGANWKGRKTVRFGPPSASAKPGNPSCS
jgi:hypothetical protein